MRLHPAIVYATLAALLLSCDRTNPVADIDPRLGIECFERHRASLPPGTQYEGIEKLDEHLLTIRIMNGVEVVTIDCPSPPDGVQQPG